MKTTKILALLLSLVMCLMAAGCAEMDFSGETGGDSSIEIIDGSETEDDDDAEVDIEEDIEEDEDEGDTAESTSTPLLYKVTDDKGNVVWVFGSIHVGRDDFYPLPDYVLDAFDNSDALAVEADIVAFEKDLSAQMDALGLMVYTDGTTVSDHIPQDLYDDAAEILEANGLYNFAMDYYIVSFWSNLVDNCAYMQLEVDIEGGIDRFLINRANDSKKEIREIESAAIQYGMMAGYSEELQVLLLEGSVESYGDLDAMKEELDEMMDLWAKGDEEAFGAYLNEEEEVDDEDAALYEEYTKAMLTDRNELMANYAEDALKSGEEVFICVGAAHVVGEGAMAKELASRGYTVEIVR